MQLIVAAPDNQELMLNLGCLDTPSVMQFVASPSFATYLTLRRYIWASPERHPTGAHKLYADGFLATGLSLNTLAQAAGNISTRKALGDLADLEQAQVIDRVRTGREALFVLGEWDDDGTRKEWYYVDSRLSQTNERTPQRGYIYVLRAANRYKIGKEKTRGERIAQHQTSSPFDVELLLDVKVANYHKAESDLHAMFAEKRVKGEWFELGAPDLTLISEYLST